MAYEHGERGIGTPAAGKVAAGASARRSREPNGDRIAHQRPGAALGTPQSVGHGRGNAGATGRRAAIGTGGWPADRCGTPGWNGSSGSTSSRSTRKRSARSPDRWQRDWTSEQELAAFWKSVVSGPIQKLLCRVGLRRSAVDRVVGCRLPQELRQNGARLVVARERRFAVREGDVLVSGSLDRLVTWQAADGRVLAADVIDFKTDRASDESQLDERVEFYRPQVLAYRRAVERLYGLDARAGRQPAGLFAAGRGAAGELGSIPGPWCNRHTNRGGERPAEGRSPGPAIRKPRLRSG